MEMKQKPQWYGPATMVAAALLFSIGGLLCKYIPWSPLAINGVRCLIGSMLIGSYLKLTHHKLVFNRTVLFGVICMFGVTTLFIVANKTTTAANAIILQFTAPVWIILMMAILLHKKPRKIDLITVIVVFAGILFFFYDSLSTGNLTGDLVAVVSGIFYAGLFMLNSLPGGDGLSSLFLGQLATGILLSPLAFRETDFSFAPVCAIVLLGLLQVGLAYVFFNLGTAYCSPITAALITGIEPILNPVLVALVWGEKLTTLSLIGAVIVIGAVLIYNLIQAQEA